MRNVEQAIKIRRSQGFVRTLAHPDRNAKARGDRLRATDVVGVLVGDENRVQVVDLELCLGQAGL